MGARDHQGAAVAQEELGEQRREGYQRDAPLLGRHDLDVVPAADIAHHHPVGAPVQIVRREARHDWDAEIR